jgi:fucokinase
MNRVEEIKNNFIKETYQDTWNVYQKSLENNSLAKWDWIVLTASNKNQADTYKQEINYRLSRNLLPQNTNYLVLEDPEGKRVGSGGATLNVLNNIRKKSTEEEFSKAKILVIHSGGDSKRVPQYSACGKLFSPVQRELPDGRTSSLFDEFIIALSAVPSRMSPGMIVLSGDVLLVFNPLQIDLHYLDSAAISIKAPVEIGCNHGVFLTDKNNFVEQFLHKQTCKKLKLLGAVNQNNYVDIDTGAIYLSTKILNELYELISTNNSIDDEKYNLFVNDSSRISFYGDFLYPLASDSTYENYLKEAAEGTINDNLLKCRKLIWEKLKSFSMKVIKLSPANFIHFGTTKELFNLLTKDINKYKCLGWNKKVLSNVQDNIKYIVNHSYISDSAIISPDVYIENSYIGENVTIGNNVVLSNVCLKNVSIPDNICLNTLISKENKCITRIYSIVDNPKVEKSLNTPFLNTYLEKMMKKYNVSEKELWDDEDKSLWKANLYTIEDSNDKSVNSALTLFKLINCSLNENEALEYFKKDRTSLYESFNRADTNKIRENNQKIEFELRSYEFINLLKEKTDINIAKNVLLKSSDIVEQIKTLIKISENYDYQIKSRTFLTISKIIKERNLKNLSSDAFEDMCYSEIKKVISTSNTCNINKEKILNSASVELPIRVNFGGGWSDTPPYCNENGGIVLNAAFKLNDENPIKVKIEKNNNNTIKLKSVDLNFEKKMRNIDELKSCSNTNDPFSLLKASLLISGIVRKEDSSIKSVVDRIGYGFNFITDVNAIPKGSGLGTSSILAGACLKAIYKFLNYKISDEELSYRVLEQEQIMGTGGGWQDQIGGIVPGIKCIYTEPGENQQFRIEKLNISKLFTSEINSRFALIYTGQRRLAKNLLRDIMNNYISYNAKTINTIEKIKNKAIEMKQALQKEDLEEYSKLLNEHWILSKILDEGCTNTCINQILKSCEDLIDGQMICGAGGGGFLQVILKKDVSIQDLENRINAVFQDSGIKVYKATLFE